MFIMVAGETSLAVSISTQFKGMWLLYMLTILILERDVKEVRVVLSKYLFIPWGT